MPAGRPFKHLDARKIEQMAMIGCSNEEIALLCDCSADTIENNYSGAVKGGKARRNHNLRKMMFESAKKGNIVMMIFLAKNWLGMRDRPELENAIEPLRELIAEYRKRYDLLSRPPAQPPEQAEAPTKNNHKKQAHEKRADDNNGGE